MNLEQWTFYVLETNVINQLKNNQKKIGLNPLLEMNQLICDFEKLKTFVIGVFIGLIIMSFGYLILIYLKEIFFIRINFQF